MGVEITMPQLSDTMHEGTILNWLKKEGDTIQRGDALAEVATDKADLEIESFHEGTLLEIRAPQGTTVKVGSIIAVIGDKSEGATPKSAPAEKPAPTAEKASVQPAPQQPAAPQPAPPQAAPQQVAPPQVAAQPAPRPVQASGNGAASLGSEGDRVKISPLARNLAENYGVDYRGLEGSGDGGRIVRRDIERAAAGMESAPQPQQQARPAVQPSAPPPAADVRPQASVPSGGVRSLEPLSRMRQTIAARMVESTTSIPHFYVTAKIQLDQLVKLRNSLKPLPQYEGLTYNHLIIRAAGIALRAVPRINAAYVDGKLLQPESVNVGIVTAVQDGLLIPVLKNADELALADIVADARGLVQRARAGRPKAEDLVGGTFSISNMGMFDVESFTAIISPGQGAILAVSPIQEEPVVADGEIRVGSVMRVTLSVDHRIIDGVMCGEFLTELKRLLEDPVLLLA